MLYLNNQTHERKETKQQDRYFPQTCEILAIIVFHSVKADLLLE